MVALTAGRRCLLVAQCSYLDDPVWVMQSLLEELSSLSPQSLWKEVESSEDLGAVCLLEPAEALKSPE